MREGGRGCGGPPEAELAVRPYMTGRTRRGEIEGRISPETRNPIRVQFFKTNLVKAIDPTFTFWGQKISSVFVWRKVSSVFEKPPREQDTSCRNML